MSSVMGKQMALGSAGGGVRAPFGRKEERGRRTHDPKCEQLISPVASEAQDDGCAGALSFLLLRETVFILITLHISGHENAPPTPSAPRSAHLQRPRYEQASAAALGLLCGQVVVVDPGGYR
uniref:Uncharacterized protein n=1 Tax=Knipowitschia caucasica TaxID=637954 RepID=A0AAV2LE78_KNICA